MNVLSLPEKRGYTYYCKGFVCCGSFGYALGGNSIFAEGVFCMLTRRRTVGMLLALLISMAFILPVAQAAGTISPSRPASSPKKQALAYDVNVVPEADMRSNSIKMSITVFNNEDWYIMMGVAKIHYDFQLLDAGGKVLYQWTADKENSFGGFWGIEAGKSDKFSFTLSGGAYNSIKDKIATFRAFILGDADFIDPKGYEVDLRPDKQMRVTARVDPGADSLKMSLSIYNGSRRDVDAGTCISEFKLYDARNKVLYSSAASKMFVPQKIVTVKAGETYTFSDTVSGSAYQKIKSKVAYMKAFVKTGASFIDQKGYMVKFDPWSYVTITPNAKMYPTYMNMSLTIRNNSADPISISHLFKSKYNFQLLDASGHAIYTWSEGKQLFEVSESTTTIGAGKSLTWTATLSGDAYKAVKSRMKSLRATVIGTADFLKSDWYTITLK